MLFLSPDPPLNHSLVNYYSTDGRVKSLGADKSDADATEFFGPTLQWGQRFSVVGVGKKATKVNNGCWMDSTKKEDGGELQRWASGFSPERGNSFCQPTS